MFIYEKAAFDRRLTEVLLQLFATTIWTYENIDKSRLK